ncbi:hypothetical protein Tco_1073316 [Tanacetum coccineum]
MNGRDNGQVLRPTPGLALGISDRQRFTSLLMICDAESEYLGSSKVELQVRDTPRVLYRRWILRCLGDTGIVKDYFKSSYNEEKNEQKMSILLCLKVPQRTMKGGLLICKAVGVSNTAHTIDEEYLANADANKKSTCCLLVLCKPIKGEIGEDEQKKLKSRQYA